MLDRGSLNRDSIYAYLGAISLIGHILVICFALVLPFIPTHHHSSNEISAQLKEEKEEILAKFPTENQYARLTAIKTRIQELERTDASLAEEIAEEPSRREKVKKQERRRGNQRVLDILREEEQNLMADIMSQESH